MLSYQSKIYGVVQKLGITDESLMRQIYQDIENKFLDRWITSLIAQLNQEDQKLVASKLQQEATPDQVYEFLDGTLENIDTLNEQILTEFIQEYKLLMGIQ